MKRGKGIILVLALAMFLAFGGVAQAVTTIQDFTGDFAPANWTVIGSGNSGSVTLGTELFGFIFYSGGAAGFQGVEMNAPGAYNISFDWQYWSYTSGIDASNQTPYYASGSWNSLATSGTLLDGAVNFDISAGDRIGWKIDSPVTTSGRSSLEISNFRATPVPIPSAVYLLGSGVIALIGLKRRKDG